MYYNQFNKMDEMQRLSFVGLSSDLYKNAAPSKGEQMLRPPQYADMQIQTHESQAFNGGLQDEFMEDSMDMMPAPDGVYYYDPKTLENVYPSKQNCYCCSTTAKDYIESSIRILLEKLVYTQKKILESENNKVMLKYKLDKMIQKLHEAGYQPPKDPPKPVSLKRPLTGTLKELAENYEKKLQKVTFLEELWKHKMQSHNEIFQNYGHNPHPKSPYHK